MADGWHRRALAGAAIYLVFGTAWVLGSDALLESQVTDEAQLLRYQSMKGAFYVAATAVLAWWLLSRAGAARRSADAAARHIRQVVRHLPVGLCDVALDGRMLAANPRMCEILGTTRDGLSRIFMHQMLRAGDLDEWRRATQELLDSGAARSRDHRRYEWHWVRADGSSLPVQLTLALVRDAAGTAVHFVCVLQDVGEIRAAQGALARSESGLRHAHDRLRLATTVFDNTIEGVIVTDASARILSVNPAFVRMMGYAEAEVIGQSPRMFRSGRHGAEFYAQMWTAVGAAGHWQGEIWNRRKSGEVFPEMMSLSVVRDGAGQVQYYVCMFTDLSQQKDSEARLDYLAHYDTLTGLPNRVLFLHQLDQVVAEGRGEQQLAVLLIDIDRFKDVNDSYGHPVGDQLLCHVGSRLALHLRHGDLLARFGGDEFALLVRQTANLEPRIAALMAALSQPWQSPDGLELATSVTLGVCLYPQQAATARELVQGADAALYRAKADGRGLFRYYTDEMTAAARARLELETRLRRAVAAGQLVLHYQPQVSVATGRIQGAEALVRWLDADEGLIPPGRFIAVAEECGLIGEIGDWVIAETCRQGRRWRDQGLPPLTLAVNVSPRQFLLTDVAGWTTRVLEETGFAPHCLELEITEGALMAREHDGLLLLRRLRTLGVRIAIDDFGTGYSSLAYLKRFPLDVLKIDRSFIADIPASADDMAISAAIIAMGHSLGVQVLAEGVETQAQLDFLRSKACDSYQGYLRSPAVPAGEFEALVRADALRDAGQTG